IPYHGERKIAVKTIKEWLLNYRRNGFEALKPKKRADRGNSRRLSPDDQDHILAIRKKFLHMPVSVFYEQLIQQGEITKKQISYSTINRLLKKHNLAGKIVCVKLFSVTFSHQYFRHSIFVRLLRLPHDYHRLVPGVFCSVLQTKNQKKRQGII